MPVFELTYPEGALAPDTRDQLLEDLTTALLRAERAPDTDFFRNVTWSYVHELPAGAVRAAGRPVERPTFKIDVTTPEGALSDRRRQELVEEALRVWVLMHEVAEGSWGAAGQVVRFEQLREAAKAQREQAEQSVPA